MIKKQSSDYGMMALYSASFFWGLSFIAQKILVEQGIPTFYMVFLRMSFVLILLFAMRKQKFTVSTVKSGAVMGVFLFLIFSLQTYGLKTLDSSVSSFITSLNLVLIPILNRIIFKSPISVVNLISVWIALFGLYFFNISDSAEFSLNIGMILTVICAIVCAVQLIYGNHYLKKENPLQLTFFQNLFCGLYAMIFALLFEGGISGFPRQWSLVSLGAILYLGFIASSLCFFLLLYGQKHITDPVKVGLIMALQPLFTMGAAMLLLNERLTLYKGIGILCIIVAIVIDEIYLIKKER